MLKRAAALLFSAALLYPLAGLLRAGRTVDLGRQLGDVRCGPVSLGLTSLAMVVVVLAGTPMALYIRRAPPRERLWWQGVLLVSILLPPIALGILISLAFGPHALGALLARAGLRMSNTPLAFVVTQVYVSAGYYVLGAVAAFDRVPRSLEAQAGLLGLGPGAVFRRVTLPLARLGLAVALSLAWVRALTEFGAIIVTAYYPAGMPVALWTNLENFGLPAVMPLLVIFLVTALPLPWLAHILAQRRLRDA